MTYNIKQIIDLCIEHEVDFEIFHGKVNGGDRVKAQMLVNISPAVRVDFGDKKHNQLVSRVQVAGNHYLKVDVEDLIKSITGNQVRNDWRNAAAAPEITGAFQKPPLNANPQMVSLQGEISSAAILDGTDAVFNMKVLQSVYNTVTKETQGLTPILIEVRRDLATWNPENRDRFIELISNNKSCWKQAYVEGEYVYPNIVKATVVEV